MKFCPQCGQRLVGLHLEEKQRSIPKPEAPLKEQNSTVKTDQHRLGPILYTHGTRHICEGGVCDNKKSILWEEVDFLFLDASKTTVNFIPAGETINVRIISTTKNEISFTQGAFFRIGGKDKSNFWGLYQFIVSKVIDRQWSKLIRDIKEGKRVTFGRFEISSSGVHRQKFFGGYDVIDLGRIAGCDFAYGELVVDFVNDKGRLKRKSLGPVREIPNIHLVQAFLSSIARQNSGQ